MPVRFVHLRMLTRTALVMATFAAAACQGTATQTSPIFITDVLTGTVVTDVPGYHVVTTFAPSSASLTLATLTPDTGVALGVGLGTPPQNPTSTDCGIQVFQTLKVGQTFTISGVPSSTYCIAVFELINNGAGAVPDPLAYTVKFNHH